MRLHQGDYSKETVYSNNPIEIAKSFAIAGSSFIHIVDLDGAMKGEPQHLELIAQIKYSTGLEVQFGGGIRNLKSLETILETGIDRVVLGTAAIENPEFVNQAVREFGAECVSIGIDAKDGIVVIKGWVESGNQEAIDLIRSMSQIGAKRFIYTDIKRDGTLSSPNFEAIIELLAHASKISPNLKMIASGGVATIAHLQRLAEIGVEGAIIGSAIYKGKVDLKEAIVSTSTI